MQIRLQLFERRNGRKNKNVISRWSNNFNRKKQYKNNVVKFEQLNIDLKDLQTGIIKVPKMQETNTLDLFECWLN